jgi:Rrf2 family protein
MGQGVEWGVHVLLLLTWAGQDSPLSTAQLAASHDLPQAYLNKQLQALVKAGLLTSTPGVRGGFRLARPPEAISLLDVVEAIEGPQEAFRCTEIRQRGAGRALPASCFRSPCAVRAAMHRAEDAWRQELARQSIADVCAAAEEHAAGVGNAMRRALVRDEEPISPAQPVNPGRRDNDGL